MLFIESVVYKGTTISLYINDSEHFKWEYCFVENGLPVWSRTSYPAKESALQEAKNDYDAENQ